MAFSWRSSWTWRLALLFCLAAGEICAQKAESLSDVKKLFVGSFGQGDSAEEMRGQLIRRLEKSHAIQIVQAPEGADAVMKGTTQIWTTGHFSTDLRSHAIREAAFSGFLSVEILGRDNQTLWSYLVTPNSFPLRTITDDLADQLAGKLLGDLKARSQPGPSASRAASEVKAVLRGAGATFPAPLYEKWLASFGERHPDVSVHYDAVGSAEGIRLLAGGGVDFGASDMPLSDEAMSENHQRFVQIPVALGAVVPIYHVAPLASEIRFTPEILAGIYLGKIKKWNDSQITSANRGVALPDAEIAVIHRSDGSGTTFVWSDYLSKVSPEWKESVGDGLTVLWPVGDGAAYNEGVASAVQQTSNSIGYVEFIYAVQHELTFAEVRNSDGRFIKADISSVTAAVHNSGSSDRDLRVSITNSSGNNAYPIASYTWVLLPEHIEDKTKKSGLDELVRWMLSFGQKSCAALGYAPLPTAIAKRGLESLDTIQ